MLGQLLQDATAATVQRGENININNNAIAMALSSRTL